MKTNNADVAALKSRMTEVFARACSILDIKPLGPVSLGSRSMACFASKDEADALVDALTLAGETSVDLYHWDPAKDPDFDRDEWQVSWGTL